jgi:serine/threonine protein kinase
VSAYEQADTDGEAVKVDIPMADVSRGKKIGSGSFGDVFEGTWKGQRVILKERKMTGPGKKYFDAEAALNRRLKSAKGVAPFLGVAGANAFLVWKDEGRNTLDAVLGGGGGGGLSLFGGGGGGGIAAAMGVGDESRAVRLFAKQLLQAVKSVHDAGVVHRDVKPDNILFAETRGRKLTGSKPVIKLIDLGGACDLRTGVNYSKDETVFDPVYGPPEKYLDVSGVGSLFGSSLGWAKAKPDLFDAFSCGMVILQVACPSLEKREARVDEKRPRHLRVRRAGVARLAARAAAGGLRHPGRERGAGMGPGVRAVSATEEADLRRAGHRPSLLQVKRLTTTRYSESLG